MAKSPRPFPDGRERPRLARADLPHVGPVSARPAARLLQGPGVLSPLTHPVFHRVPGSFVVRPGEAPRALGGRVDGHHEEGTG